MNDEELRRLLDGIGPEGDELDELDEALEALARGELSPAEANRLRARVSADRPDLLDLFEPLEEDYIARTAARVVAMRPADPAPVVWSEADRLAQVEETQAIPAKVSWWKRWVGGWSLPQVFVPVLVAAVAAVVVLPPLSGPAPLPPYSVEILSGDRMQRSDLEGYTELPAVSHGSLLRFAVKPEQAVAGRVQVAVYAVEGERWAPVQPDVEHDPDSGAVLIIGEVGEVFDATLGAHELAVVLGSAGAELAAEAARAGAPGTLVLRVRYEVEAPIPR
jgi:hypothetical protein